MKKALSIISKFTLVSVSSLIQSVIFIIALFLIFFLSYILGRSYLLGNSFAGNDTTNFFNVVYWLSQTFPKVPFWFPLQGGGISFTGYPWFSAYLVNIIDKLTVLDLVQSFRFLGFLSVPLTGLGIFVFIWTRLKEVKPIWMRQILGLIASVFFVTAPVSWIWLLQWGFYAEQVSLIFVPWILLFFDLFIEQLFTKKTGWLFRLGFLGTLVFLLLGFITHFFIGVTSLVIFGIWIAIKVIFTSENKILLIKRIFLPLLFFVLAFAGMFAFRYYSYQRYSDAVAFGGFSGYGTASANKEVSASMLLKPEHMLSLSDPRDPVKEPRIVIKSMRFPFYVWLLIIPSFVFAVFKSKKVFAFSIFSTIGFFVNTNIDLYIFFNEMPIIKSIPLLNQFPLVFLGRIFFSIGRILIPISAAFGAYIIWELLWSFVFVKLLSQKQKVVDSMLYNFKVIIVLFFTILTVGLLINKYYNLPSPLPYYLNIGHFTYSGNASMFDENYKTPYVNVNGINLRDIWGKNKLSSQDEYLQYLLTQKNPKFKLFDNTANFYALRYYCVVINNYEFPSDHICTYYRKTKVTVNSTTIFPPLDIVLAARNECDLLADTKKIGKYNYCLAFYKHLFEQLSFNQWPKFTISNDISGITSGAKSFVSVLPKNRDVRFDVSGFAASSIMSLPLISNHSSIQIYMNTLNLIYNSWNYQSQVMYTTFPLLQKPGVLSELAKWFGLEYVYLTGSPSEPHSYWKEDKNWSEVKVDEKGLGWRSFNLPTGEATWDNRPLILIISDNSKYFYDQTFKLFTKGALTYDMAIPVQGNKTVDAYSANELKKYHAIYMRGYDYNSRNKAYKLLDEYIKNGGILIFDTGWQYYVPDYQLDRAPAFMPFESLVWENLDTSAHYEIQDTKINNEVDASKLGDLKYDIGSWGVSVPTKLREWAKPVVTYADKPLVVKGRYGKGQVVWYGFNLVPHQEAKDSIEEVKLFNSLLTQVLPKTNSTLYSVNTNKNSADSITFTFSDSVNDSSSFYFRNAYYPDWKAKLISKKSQTDIRVERSGPGFMLMKLPPITAGDRLNLEIKPSLGQIIANLVSISTGILILFFFFIPGPLRILFSKFRNINIIKLRIRPLMKISGVAKKHITKVSKWDTDENDY